MLCQFSKLKLVNNSIDYERQHFLISSPNTLDVERFTGLNIRGFSPIEGFYRNVDYLV